MASSSSMVEIHKTKVFDLGSTDPESGEERNQFVCSSDEVYDTVLVSAQTNCVAVASNSEQLRIQCLDREHGGTGFGHGHTQSILCVDSPDWDERLIASGSKDNSILFWRMRALKTPPMEVDQEAEEEEQQEEETEAEDFGADRVAIATGHTHSVASIAFSHAKNLPFLVSVSTDTTLKLWLLTDLIVKQEKGEPQPDMFKLSASTTLVAHSKDINSVDVSSNDKLCVTASMDKTAKLWHIDRKKGELTIGGTLSGHKRGVWSARFSRNLQLVATCSGDLTIKLFSLVDKSCTRTLEGHQFAVLSVLFIDKSSKLVSVDGGGLVKVWDVQKGICERTEEGHSDKIWSLRELPSVEPADDASDIRKPKARFITGAADGQFALWEDVSEEAKAQKQKEQQKRVTDMQTLANLVEQERLFEALVLCLDLKHPFQCLKVLNKMSPSSSELPQVMKRLNQHQLGTLLDYASQWNTNTRTYATGQMVLSCLLRSVHPEQLLKLPNFDDTVKAFLPYSIRHYNRLQTLRKNAAQLNYIFSCMRLN